MRRRPSAPSRLLALIPVAGVLVIAAVSAVVYDHSRSDKIAEGVSIGGVDVGGMTRDAAHAKLERTALAPRRRTVRIHAGGQTISLTPAQTQVTAEIDPALDRAVADSRKGWIGSRVVHGLTGRKLHERIHLTVHYAPGVVSKAISQANAAVRQDPVDASVTPSATGLKKVPARAGRALDAGALRSAVEAALRFPSKPADIQARTEVVQPKVTAAMLAGRYPAYIVVDRKDHVLRFYKNLKLDRTYPIAVGKAGLETPAGLYDIQWKEVNPPWRVPNSAWAGDLAGKTIPPGPDDPIKARWMAFDGSAGIHGIDPSEYGSIGHDASHGCVRMRIPDVISLYARTPVHTPVYIA